MTIVTKNRGSLRAIGISFTPNGSHDMVVEWHDGSYEHMRLWEIVGIYE